MPDQPIQLGDEVEDVVAKVRGIAHGHLTYLDGTEYWIIQPAAEDGAILAKEVHSSAAYTRRIGDGVRVKPKPQAGFHVRELQE